MSSISKNSTRSYIPLQNKYDRIVLLIDMDCFFCQVEEKLDKTLKGKPVAVVQYNAWGGGGIIAVNYIARANGVTRHMRGDEAKEKCPDIQLVKVPNNREKADTTRYRDAGKEVAIVLQQFTSILERASVDEAYLDITESVNNRLESMNAGTFVLQPQQLANTYAVGYAQIGEYVTKINSGLSNTQTSDNYDDYNDIEEVDEDVLKQSDIRLLIGSSIASEIRAAIKEQTSYECSAGIAHNKILAKLACGLNKPNKQTILPLAEIPKLFETLPVGKITGLGGKFGEEICERLGVRFLGQLLQFSESDLKRKFDDKNGAWLYLLCRGIDLEAVTPRFYSKSIGCCKKFPGRNNITGLKTLSHWLDELASEIEGRLEKDLIENNRKAKQMVVSFIQEFNGEEISSSRSAPLSGYDKEILAKQSLELIKLNTKQFLRIGSDTQLHNPIKFLGISVGKFETITSGQTKLQEMFANQAARMQKNKENSSVVNDRHDVEENGGADEEINIASGSGNQKSSLVNYLQKAKEKAKHSTETDKIDETNSNDIEENKIEASSSPSCEIVVEENIVTNCTNSNLNPAQKRKIDNDDYRANYAEYAIPELRPEYFQYIECEECGKKILADENSIQTHKDHHYALQLSQQQRDEYRTEIKMKVNLNNKSTSSSPSISANKKSKLSVTTFKCDIKKFLKPTEPPTSSPLEVAAAGAIVSQPSSSAIAPQQSSANVTNANDNASEMELCDQCKMLIKKDTMLEHMDFHMAKTLQKQFNLLEVHTVAITKKSAPTEKQSKKRSPKNPSTSSAGHSSTHKPITQFFTQ